MAQITSLVKWFEIPACDFDRAVRFYSAIFDVSIEICNFNGILYGMFPSDTGGISGAIVKSEKTNETHSGPILYFYLEYGMNNITEKILSLGGKMVSPKNLITNKIGKDLAIIPRYRIDTKVGYFAVFLDSEGNKMALYSNS